MNYDCQDCAATFRFQATLKEHIRSVHRHSYSCRFICPECGDRLPDRIMLNLHIRTEHQQIFIRPEPNGRFYCCFCPKHYSVKSSLKTHINHMHTSIVGSTAENKRKVDNSETEWEEMTDSDSDSNSDTSQNVRIRRLPGSWQNRFQRV